MARKLDFTLNPPKSKNDLSKENMLAFIKKLNKEDDTAWFLNLMDSNKIKKTNNLNKEIIDAYDLPVIREEFAKRFFPELSKKGRNAAKAKAAALSFEEQLNALRK